MWIEDHLIAAEARIDAQAIELARLTRESDELRQMLFAVVQGLMGSLPLVRADGSRVRVVTAPLDEPDPQPCGARP